MTFREYSIQIRRTYIFTKYKFNVQERNKIRVIVDTDAACEADDQYAIAHALLTPRFEIKGIIAEQFYRDGGEESVNKSYDEIKKVLDLMDIDNIPVLYGAIKRE